MKSAEVLSRKAFHLSMDIMENNYFNGRYPRVINPETKVDANSVFIVRFLSG
jgi:hypothetical protein